MKKTHKIIAIATMNGFLALNMASFQNFALLAINNRQIAFTATDIQEVEAKTVESSTPQAPSLQKYVVQKGDNLTKIARKFEVIEKQIKEVNNLDAGEKIIVGQEIIIPDAVLPSYEGVASWYGQGFNGRQMANGEIYNQNEILAAHRTLPLGSKVKVTNLANGKTVTAEVSDRGPYIFDDNGEHARDIDLSYAAAKQIGMVGAGLAKVQIETILQ